MRRRGLFAAVVGLVAGPKVAGATPKVAANALPFSVSPVDVTHVETRRFGEEVMPRLVEYMRQGILEMDGRLTKLSSSSQPKEARDG